MRIAILTEILSTHSGSRVPIELAKHLSLNNEVTLLAFDFKTEREVKIDLEKKGVKVVLITPHSIPFGKWLAALKILPHLKENEIISFHGTLPAFLIAKLSHRPLIKTYYGTQLDAYLEKFIPGEKPNLLVRLLNWMVNQIILLTQRVFFLFSHQSVAISQYTQREARRLYGKNIPYVYLGATPLSSSSIPNTKYQIPNTILSVSRLTPYKGFHHLIKVFKELNKEIPQLRLTITGSAPKKNYLNYLLAIKNTNVQILTDVSDQKLALLYRECQIYATCDRYLFFGLPPVEAAYFGKPTVALNFAAASEIIQDGQTGYVAKNLTAFKEGLKKLIQDEKLRKDFGKMAQDRAKTLFSWPVIARKYEKLFSALLEKRNVIKQKAKSSLKLPLFIAFMISLIFGLPHLVNPLLLGGPGNYYPLAINHVPITTFEESYVYASQAREVCDGHPLSADAHLAEYKNLPSLTPLPFLFAGSLGCLIGSVSTIFVMSDFLLPPLIFLVVYLLLFKCTSHRTVSIFGAVLLLTTDRLFLFLPPLNPDMFKAFWDILTINGTETVPLEFTRFPYPQFAFLILALHLYFLLRALKEKTLLPTLFSAAFLGLLFYTYFYYWTFVLAGTAVLFLVFLFQKNFTAVKILTLNTAIAFLVSIPYWFSFFQFQMIPASQDILERMGLESGRIRNLFRTAQYLAFALLFFKLIKNKDLYFWFLLAFLLGGVAALNIQIFTGYTLQSWHWTTRVINPFIIILITYLFFQFFKKGFIFQKFFSPLLTILIIFFLLRGLALQFVVAKNSYRGYTLPQSTLEAFSWLNQNTPKDSVIVTPSFETSSLIPIYTHDNIFLPLGNVTVASNKEIIERLLITYKIFEIKRDQLAGILAYRGDGMGDCRRDTCLVKFEFWEKQAIIELFYYKYLRKNESLSSWSTFYEMPQEEQQRILNLYDEFSKKPSLFSNKFKMDYIYYGPTERKIKEMDFGNYPWAKEIYRNQNVTIYRIEKDADKKG